MEEQDWLEVANRKKEKMPKEAKELRLAAEQDLCLFAQLVNPGYVYGDIHMQIFRWMMEYSLFGQGNQSTANKLIMLPRAHLKSHMVATWAAWIVTRHPEITMLYVSATSGLAETQLFAIKNILGSSLYRRFWPEYIHPQEGKREAWNNNMIRIDHPKRREEGIRDATIATAGLTTNTTGWHADIIVADDLVVPENAYTEDGRESVSKKASQFTSIRNAGGFTMACGTRYHPDDVYATWKEQTYDEYDEETEDLIGTYPIWEIKEHKVEEDGIFLWPRTVRGDGKAFGFNNNVLSRIKGEYTDRVQFYAQYYNDPNDPGSERVNKENFQYYDLKFLREENGQWFYKKNKLNVYAAIDFAYSLNARADYTSIVVIGMDCEGDIYILDIDRFKTDKISEYFQHIKELHSRWNFKKIRAEVTAAQDIIVNDVRDYVKRDGMKLSVEKFRPTRKEGSKEERIAAALEHRYDNMQMWHFKGGYTPVLEEELIQARPAHDDVKDALASVVEIAVRPTKSRSAIDDFMGGNVLPFNPRFGGIN